MIFLATPLSNGSVQTLEGYLFTFAIILLSFALTIIGFFLRNLVNQLKELTVGFQAFKLQIVEVVTNQHNYHEWCKMTHQRVDERFGEMENKINKKPTYKRKRNENDKDNP